MNQWKSAHAVRTKARTLEEAMKGADVFFGLSVKGAVTKDMVKSMAEEADHLRHGQPRSGDHPGGRACVRGDAIIATGRSDYPNQVNNVLGFPYIFRGALDVRATTINEEMKVAAAEALAEAGARGRARRSRRRLFRPPPRFGPEYIIPVPFDPRLIVEVPAAVAQGRDGHRRRAQADRRHGGIRAASRGRLDPTGHFLQSVFEQVRPTRSASSSPRARRRRSSAPPDAFRDMPATARRSWSAARSREVAAALGITDDTGLEIHNARLSTKNAPYADLVYKRLQRRATCTATCQRMVNQDRNVFGACMVAAGDADGMVTGITRRFPECYADVKRVINIDAGKVPMGYSIVVSRQGTVFLADTSINETPSPEQLATIAKQMVKNARMMGHEPRVAFLSFSNFGSREIERIDRIRKAIRLLDAEQVDFEYDGEMQADMALDYELLKSTYPFTRLTGPANILVMPGLHSAHISSRLMQSLGGVTVIGPVIDGLSKPVQIVQMGATVSDLVNHAALAAYGALISRR
jgi:malate dehydrogenase (oxaloacetate-decarboxylating)(NADP+)